MNSRVQLSLLGTPTVNAHEYVYRGGVGTNLSRGRNLKTSYKACWMKQCPVNNCSLYTTFCLHLSQYGTERNYRKWTVSRGHCAFSPACESTRGYTYTGKIPKFHNCYFNFDEVISRIDRTQILRRWDCVCR